MQRRRHRPDHVIADEHRQHEDRQPEHEGVDGVERGTGHGEAPKVISAPSYAALCGMKFGCTTAPSRVSAVDLTISSSQLTASFFSFLSIRISRKVSRFLA